MKRFGYWKDSVFLAGISLYGLNRFVLKPLLPAGEQFFRGHFNDCLLVWVALPIFLATYRMIGIRKNDHFPKFGEVAFHVLMWSLFFEIIGPKWLHHGTGDLWDVIFYGMGGVAAWILWHWGDLELIPI